MLGILSTNGGSHILKKRESEQVPNTSDTNTSNERPNEPIVAGEVQEKDFVFYSSDILMYTRDPPLLNLTNGNFTLNEKSPIVTTNKIGSIVRLKVRYVKDQEVRKFSKHLPSQR